jgi:aconitase A
MDRHVIANMAELGATTTVFPVMNQTFFNFPTKGV